jgi:hypothetical protein
MVFSVVGNMQYNVIHGLMLCRINGAVRGPVDDFSVVVPGPPFCHRKTRKIPGGDRLQRDQSGPFLRENSPFVRSGEALFLRGLPRKKWVKTQKNRVAAAGLAGF